jgi:spore coat protein U-like protein
MGMRNQKLVLTVAMSGALVVGSARLLSAATATANLGIGTTVNANCSITTTAVTFPTAYDPVGVNAGADSDGTGNIAVTCTKGAGTSIALNLGVNFTGTQARMKGPGATDFLNYSLYSDAGRTVDWCGVTRTIAAAPSKATQNFIVYARIPRNQDVSVGAYADTVVATLNY